MKNFNVMKDGKLEAIKEQIKDLLNECCSDCGEKQAYTQQIIIETIIWGSQNVYEGIGILEMSKQEYKEIVEEVLADTE